MDGHALGEPITAVLSSIAPYGSNQQQVDYSNTPGWNHNGACIGGLFVFWQANGVWRYGVSEWLPAGTMYRFATSSFYNANNNPAWNVHINPGDPIGVCIGSTDGATKGQRSNVIFMGAP
jgi:hypothetical protein